MAQMRQTEAGATTGEYKRGVLPMWGGIPTFVRAPLREIEDLKEGMVAVAGVPHDQTSGAQVGPRFGPRAIRESSLQLAFYMQTAGGSSLYDVRTGQRLGFRDVNQTLADVGDLNTYPVDVDRAIESLRGGVAAILRQGAFPVILGGDHYISYPCFLGFADVMAERGIERVGYVQLDAHFDLADDSVAMGQHYNGTNARRASEHPMLNTENMVWIGLSGYARGEQWDWTQQNGAHVYTINDVRKQGAAAVAREAVEHATRGCDAIYVTIDIDCVGSSYCTGVGGINVDGMTPRDLLDIVDVLAEAPVGAFDFVEVNPLRDSTGVTERVAAIAILDFLRPRLTR